jgi:hypothetical protein
MKSNVHRVFETRAGLDSEGRSSAAPIPRCVGSNFHERAIA